MKQKIGLPTFQTVLKAIAYADGCLRGHKNYLTKHQMITLAKIILNAKRKPKGKA